MATKNISLEGDIRIIMNLYFTETENYHLNSMYIIANSILTAIEYCLREKLEYNFPHIIFQKYSNNEKLKIETAKRMHEKYYNDNIVGTLIHTFINVCELINNFKNCNYGNNN